ncbi:MAG: hypothetical protein FWC50_03985 [Planctomycetaceae bacterium]|nr:hypothetical protein [Planctomycetaceae bacterium]
MATESQNQSSQAVIPEELRPEAVQPVEKAFVDRRQTQGNPPGVERRQFANHYGDLSEESRELATAIDQYKLLHRRRFITYDEMLAVIKSLGYHK